ncbi:peroxidase-like isoform X2 [Anopheles albimanus]|uniref:peroxidase-like isoform X1 n=1 Tax=Anopheles albimanus TaxID=7167 RepID=UPI00163E3A13|nr:peroxidase-like isoform X1 [Anopheles albimanus]XP_035787998.1 peroxidase-like isoform X2 [Anopheles albimanus]
MMWDSRVLALLLAVLCGLRETSAQCVASEPYRSFDGSCNNLQNPTWGSTNTKFNRLIPARYNDGISSPRLAQDGSELPNPRLLSVEVFGEGQQNSPQFTLANMQFGQIVAHDMALTRGVRDPVTCCANGRLQPNPGARCFAIRVAEDDPVFSERNIECLNMIRTTTTCDLAPTNCTQAEQINSVTSFLDLSLVYGNTVAENTQLRTLSNGLLKVETRGGNDWPPRHPNASTTCTLRTPVESCYLTGDGRANQSPHLALLQIAFVREHNRIARILRTRFTAWNDEKLFQEARRINIAQYQHIVYNEYLPNLLGLSYMRSVGLNYATPGFVNDYGVQVNPSVLNEHTTAAFRFFHSAIQGTLKLYEQSKQLYKQVDINDHTNNPTILEETTDRYADLLRGMTTQPMGLHDDSLDPATKHFLFRFNNRFGTDLKSIDIQRARDHGLPGYNDYLQYCGLYFNARANKWADYNQFLLPDAVELLSIYYRSVNDLDLAVGLAFEKKIDGSEVGAVMRCILTEQFSRTRRGDRFFYENGQSVVGFTLRQLTEIRKANMARILCDTTTNVQEMQRFAFLLPSNTNPITPCPSLPTPTLTV